MKTTITYESVLTDLTIEERNEKFNNLDEKTQRLEIAWDALNLVVEELIKPSVGTYWNFSLRSVRGNSKELQETFTNKEFYQANNCEVCQRGLMMLSQIRLGNSIDSKEFQKEKGRAGIIKGFSMDTFMYMENEYERSQYKHPYNNNSKEKLANICCNVITNGDFYISDKTDYLIH